MPLAVILAIVAFATAVLSGVFGMAGGVILMGVYVVALPVRDAMVLHGVTQLAANGSRALFLVEHARWRVVGTYAVGAVAALLVGAPVAAMKVLDPDRK